MREREESKNSFRFWPELGGQGRGGECQKSFEFQAKTAVYLIGTMPLCWARNTMCKTKALGFLLQPQYFLSCCHFHLGAWAVP